MLSRIFALFGSCSKRTSSTSTVSRLSFVSVRNSRRRSSIGQRPSSPGTASPAAAFREPDQCVAKALKDWLPQRPGKTKITAFRRAKGAEIQLYLQGIERGRGLRAARPLARRQRDAVA